jgi:predicted Fe-Mo cluster-binding NifX family protein
MIIAVTHENGQVFAHFGKCKEFVVYHTEDGEIKSEKIVDASGYGHAAQAGLLSENNVEVLICGGIGAGAISMTEAAGIKVYPGVTGSAKKAVEDLLSGKEIGTPGYHCNHHDHEEEHSCQCHEN